MQLETLISSSGEFYYIDRLDDIIKIAALTKAKMFFLSDKTSVLYGSFEEPYSIIETVIPFKPTNSLYFSNTMYGSTSLKEAISRNKTFFYVPEYPWILFSENSRASLINGHIAFDYESLRFINTVTGEVINDCLITYYPDDMFIMDTFKRNLGNWFAGASWYLTSPGIVYENAHDLKEIQWVIQNKVTEGSILMSLGLGQKQFTFYIFKALVGSMTKKDSLNIIVYPDPFSSNSIVIEFIVYKNKLKLDIENYDNTSIHTFVRMLNLSYKTTG